MQRPYCGLPCRKTAVKKRSDGNVGAFLGWEAIAFLERYLTLVARQEAKM